MKHKIRINKGRVFSGTYRTVLTVALVCGMMAMVVEERSELGFALLILQSFLLMILWTSFRILEIDVKERRVSWYITIMAKKFNRQESAFVGAPGIYIREGGNRRARYFEVVLKFEGKKEVILLSDDDRQILVERSNNIAERLGVTIIE